MKMDKLYQEVLSKGDFRYGEKLSCPQEGQFYYNIAPDKGNGMIWCYSVKNMFLVQKQDFCFYQNFYLKSPCTDFLALQYFESVSGEEFCPACKLSSNTFRLYVGESDKIFRAVYHKNIPIHSVSISIMPEFYDKYFREAYGALNVNIKEVFKKGMCADNSPQLIAILKQIKRYDGRGVAAEFFYQSKVLEALSVILNECNSEGYSKEEKDIKKEDELSIKAVAEYIERNYAAQNSLQNLSRIACMGTTKLKTLFPVCYGCNISEYILTQKMKKAMRLLLETDLKISEVARRVGYERADSFSKQFKKSTGVLPSTYRKKC